MLRIGYGAIRDSGTLTQSRISLRFIGLQKVRRQARAV
jgi:hypothetical protein